MTDSLPECSTNVFQRNWNNDQFVKKRFLWNTCYDVNDVCLCQNKLDQCIKETAEN